MKDYTPEHPFEVTDDCRMVYNLKHHSFRKGKEVFENDIAISIYSKLDADVMKEIACLIRDTLNQKYPVKQQ